MQRSTRWRAGLTAILVTAASLVALTPSPAAAACASRTTKYVSGTVTGADGWDVNATVAVDIVDAQGHVIMLADGCPKPAGTGYSAPQVEPNRYLDGNGAPHGSMMANGLPTKRTWRVSNLPSNAKTVWIEVYSRRWYGQCPGCLGTKDIHKYGYTMRHAVPVGTTGISLRLPVTCGHPGGSTGAIQGSVKLTNGTKVTPSRAMAWSQSSGPTGIGWGSGELSLGSYKVGSLASGQAYDVRVSYHGHTYRRTGVKVSACKTTPLSFTVS